jgi:hypothetical protein
MVICPNIKYIIYPFHGILIKKLKAHILFFVVIFLITLIIMILKISSEWKPTLLWRFQLRRRLSVEV